MSPWQRPSPSPVLALAAAGLLALGACSPDTGEETTTTTSAGSTSASTPAGPAVAADVVLGEADAPAGYEYSDVAEPAQSTFSGTVDGVHFQIYTSQDLDDQQLTDLAQAQVDKIRNR